jgi:putative SOS response-associated peptidase YedK
MCGRFALNAPPAKLIQQFDLDECAEFSPRYNIAPGTDIPVIRQSPEGKRVLHLLRWGLIPHWTKDPTRTAMLNNARGESLTEKPSFKEAFKKRRCLIPADGFYEWKTEGKTKQPYYFSLKSEETMALAGLWESWTAPDGNILRTVCIITTEANEVMAPIHHRMPVIITPENWQVWLNEPADVVGKLVTPPPGKSIRTWAVDRRVSRAVEEGAILIDAVAEERKP